MSAHGERNRKNCPLVILLKPRVIAAYAPETILAFLAIVRALQK
jgi:hypothetical protein